MEVFGASAGWKFTSVWIPPNAGTKRANFQVFGTWTIRKFAIIVGVATHRSLGIRAKFEVFGASVAVFGAFRARWAWLEGTAVVGIATDKGYAIPA